MRDSPKPACICNESLTIRNGACFFTNKYSYRQYLIREIHFPLNIPENSYFITVNAIILHNLVNNYLQITLHFLTNICAHEIYFSEEKCYNTFNVKTHFKHIFEINT